MKKIILFAMCAYLPFLIFGQTNQNDKALYDSIMVNVKKKYPEKVARLDSLAKATKEKYKGQGIVYLPAEIFNTEAFFEHETMLQFLDKNPNSDYSMELLSKYLSEDYHELSKLYNPLSDSIKNTPTGKEFALKLANMKNKQNGKIAPDFTSTDQNGKTVSLSSFRGKYVLLDFWGSWCGPCRKESPFLVKAYEKYHNKNFTILSVAAESKKEDWLKAIKDDQFTWTQVSDMKGMNSDAAKKYVIEAVPQNFLIDPKGKIIAQGLRGENLEKTLQKYLK